MESDNSSFLNLQTIPPDVFGVSKHAIKKWLSDTESVTSFSGDICICGHPGAIHQDGRRCLVSPTICTCAILSPLISVSDTRFFYRSTKGPHEAHALVQGIHALKKSHGNFELLRSWSCYSRGCSEAEFVGPVKLKDNRPTLQIVIRNEKNVLLCDECLSHHSNGKKFDNKYK